MKHEQLNWVFAEAPQGSGDREMPDLWASPSSRLHKTQVKEFERFVTGPADASQLMEAAASEFNLWVSLHIQPVLEPQLALFATEITSKEPDA